MRKKCHAGRAYVPPGQFAEVPIRFRYGPFDVRTCHTTSSQVPRCFCLRNEVSVLPLAWPRYKRPDFSMELPTPASASYRASWGCTSRTRAASPKELLLTYERDVYEKYMAIVQCVRPFSHGGDPAAAPLPYAQGDVAVCVGNGTGWTLDTRESFVTVRPSSIHGLGVFAVAALDSGMLVTTYPVDVILVDDKRILLNRDNRPDPDAHRFNDYCMNMGGGAAQWCVSADCRVHPDHRCGHMINDARGTDHQVNCAVHLLLGGVVCAIGVTRRVDAGEELFLSYGDGYWAARTPNVGCA